jgi:phosphatidylglycerophosphate synthase
VTKKPAKKKKPAARKTVEPAKLSAPDETAAPPAPRAPVTGLEFAPAQNYQAAFCIVGSDGPPMFGLSARERLRRQFARAGLVAEIAADATGKHRGPLIVVRADAVIDQPLIDVIIKRPGLVLTTEAVDGKAVVAANIRSSDVKPVIENMEGTSTPLPLLLLLRAPSELEAAYWKALRKRETPYALTVTPTNRKSIERRMFMGTYKGATDVVTKHLWPVPAFHTTRFLAPRGVTPNMVTMIAAILTALAFFLFLKGEFAFGIIAAWAMTFLDTVDGKLARTTLTSSKWGDVFDHGIDLVHPPFWYAAWAVGLATWGINWSSALFWWVLTIILGGYVLQRLMEGAAIKWLGIEIHIWRPIDTLFRQVTARRNPNLVLLTLSILFQKPDWGLIAVAVWTGLCLVLHAIQLVQAFASKPKGGPLPSWMAGP